MEQGKKMVDIAHSYESFNHQHNSKEHGQDRGTREVCCADNGDNKIKEGWKSDGGDEETSQCADAGSASASSPTQLNADSRESRKPSRRLEEETQ